ncbi:MULTISPECIES: MarR family winged helix-turn-helix transcriptional regulator [Lysinibacillus]|uniref:MarR family winged helix-turn-helix transcriptional regulator n=1 Tax=Lysinibacillus TaxID=400634 RepID=UPI001CBA8647|nr:MULTISPECIES: MarR family winged helix-turn-helix transcriptional regulator [Lysinibacillus]
MKSRDVIDLLSERHELLRQLVEEKWNKHHNIYISNSEWCILGRVYKKELMISEVAKDVDFSRQATHKFIKSLEAKGLVKVINVEHSKKHKAIQMTELGQDCFEKNEHYKAVIVQQLINTIGEDQVTKLKKILKLNWNMEHLKA